MIIDLEKIDEEYSTDLDKYSLYSGADIYSKELNLIFHQPLLIEYGFIGEKQLLKCISLLSLKKSMFDTKKLSDEEKEEIKRLSDFDFFITTLNKDKELKIKFLDLLKIVFPFYKINLNCEKGYISFEYEKVDNIIIYITKLNYNIFRFYINSILDMTSSNGEKDNFNPVSVLSKRIARDLEKAREKVSGRRKEDSNSSLLSNIISALSIGSKIPVNVILNNYTLIQLFDGFQRFKKYEEYHQSIDSIYAGAQDVEVKNWLGDI